MSNDHKVIDLNKVKDRKRQQAEGALYRQIADSVSHLKDILPKKHDPKPHQ